MNRIFYSILITLLYWTTALAQPQEQGEGRKKEKIAAMKVAFLTDHLNLTPSEAEKFWPVYNQYQKKLEELRQQNRQEIRKGKQNFETLSEQEVETLIDAQITFKQKELDIIREMHDKLKTVLSPKKIAKLYGSEEQFKLKLLQMVKEKKNK